jgi:hypothetical protein
MPYDLSLFPHPHIPILSSYVPCIHMSLTRCLRYICREVPKPSLVCTVHANCVSFRNLTFRSIRRNLLDDLRFETTNQRCTNLTMFRNVKLRPSAGGCTACARDTEVRVAKFDSNAFAQGFDPEAGKGLDSALPTGVSPLKNSVPFESLKDRHHIH